MKRILNLILFLIVIFSSLHSAQVKVKLVVRSENVKTGEEVFIAGNQTEFGLWYPNLVPFDKVSDSLWEKEFTFEKGTILEYKFTKGSWETEALDENRAVPGNYRLKIENDTIITNSVRYWNQSTQIKPRGQVTGRVDYYPEFKASHLLSRTIIVWLPPDYDENPKKHYPVLYMHDAQNIFDPSTSTFGIDWQIDDTADSLIRKKIIEPIIVVGIYNSVNRSREYTNGDTGKYYQNFIINELKPFIDSTYQTKSDAKNTAVAGASLGGLISFILAWENPDIFSKAACLSPAFFYKKYPWLDYLSPVMGYKNEKKPLMFYIDIGGLGVDSVLRSGTERMVNELERIGYVEGKDLIFFYDENADHNEEAWSRRVWRFLEFFFKSEN